jgi:hypothetical protein
MAFIPADAKWYLADLVESISVEGDPRILVHVNTLLVRADSPAEAYSKAQQLGRQAKADWKNEAGKRVRIRFAGLRELNVIHDELQHGAELSYSVRTVRSAMAAKALTTPKRSLAVFAPRAVSGGPDYAAGDLMRRMKAALSNEAARPVSKASRRPRGK